jgi:hypothetical protein
LIARSPIPALPCHLNPLGFFMLATSDRVKMARDTNFSSELIHIMVRGPRSSSNHPTECARDRAGRRRDLQHPEAYLQRLYSLLRHVRLTPGSLPSRRRRRRGPSVEAGRHEEDRFREFPPSVHLVRRPDRRFLSVDNPFGSGEQTSLIRPPTLSKDAWHCGPWKRGKSLAGGASLTNLQLSPEW